jgi:hypothetical protein
MGMSDWYKPGENLECPVCKVALNGWQGEDGPNALSMRKSLKSIFMIARGIVFRPNAELKVEYGLKRIS